MNALEINNLQKIYKNGIEAVKGIDLVVEQGDFFALLGPNGAGKSTTIGIISSLVKKTHGSVKIFGYDLDKETFLAKSHIGLVPQEFNFNVFQKVENILINQAGFYGIPRREAKNKAEFYLKKLDLWDKHDAQTLHLSGGQKRRLMIARALMHEPQLLILDEPTAGVDIEIRRLVWQFLQEINQKGTTIILTTHYLEEAEHLCKNIGIIHEGKIIENSSMQNLLLKLNVESFILNLKDPIDNLPPLTEFSAHLLDPITVEVNINKDQTLNQLFQRLSHFGLDIISMRNKSNRLEELFLNLTSKN